MLIGKKMKKCSCGYCEEEFKSKTDKEKHKKDYPYGKCIELKGGDMEEPQIKKKVKKYKITITEQYFRFLDYKTASDKVKQLMDSGLWFINLDTELVEE